MSKSSARKQANFLGPHPLAQKLLAELPSEAATVLEIGGGSGRNLRALRAAGLNVHTIEELLSQPLPRAPFDAVLSTHALLHGTPESLAASMRCIRALLKPQARLYATFGSTHDSRYGHGTKIDANTFAPVDGDEAGVAHAYFNEAEMRKLLDGLCIEDLSEVAVDKIAGSWAHSTSPLSGAMHWFATAKKP
ncbi:MAG: class I SAM-dependent methyltransferase [Candidatus Eremiobacteraeota bacterium]|nr:class I SAM-dependent methyltransferase [Candidatus Eremiobacteraeota bacterium]